MRTPTSSSPPSHEAGDEFEGTTVSFSQGPPAAGIVTVTGATLDQLFVRIDVTQN